MQKPGEYRNSRGEVTTQRQALNECRVDLRAISDDDVAGHALLEPPPLHKVINFTAPELLTPLEGERRCICGHLEGVHMIGEGMCVVPGCPTCDGFVPAEAA